MSITQAQADAIYLEAIGIEYDKDRINHIVKVIDQRNALRDALFSLEIAFADGSLKFTTKRQSDSDPYHPANMLMSAALAKVRGQ